VACCYPMTGMKGALKLGELQKKTIRKREKETGPDHARQKSKRITATKKRTGEKKTKNEPHISKGWVVQNAQCSVKEERTTASTASGF